MGDAVSVGASGGPTEQRWHVTLTDGDMDLVISVTGEASVQLLPDGAKAWTALETVGEPEAQDILDAVTAWRSAQAT